MMKMMSAESGEGGKKYKCWGGGATQDGVRRIYKSHIANDVMLGIFREKYIRMLY